MLVLALVPLGASLAVNRIMLLLIEVHLDRLAHLLARSTITEHLDFRSQLSLQCLQGPLLLVSLSALSIQQSLGRNPSGLDLLLETLVLAQYTLLLLARQVDTAHLLIHLLLRRSALQLLLLAR